MFYRPNAGRGFCLLLMIPLRDFAVVTRLIWALLTVIVGESMRVLSLCLDLISMNSFLVLIPGIYSNFFALSQL